MEESSSGQNVRRKPPTVILTRPGTRIGDLSATVQDAFFESRQSLLDISTKRRIPCSRVRRFFICYNQPMKSLSYLLENLGHHAHLVIGNIEQNYEGLRLAIHQKVSSKHFESADVWSRTFENLNIDDAREIKEIHNTRPIGQKRIVLVALRTIQSEAQNSLLKLFEDPQSDTVFFVCAAQTEIFLPTVLSRFNVVNVSGTASEEYQKLVSKFLAGNIKERFNLIEPIVKEKDKVQTEKFLNSLEASLYGKDIESAVFDSIFSARHFLRSRSPSVKMILENLCGIVPVISNVTKS